MKSLQRPSQRHLYNVACRVSWKWQNSHFPVAISCAFLHPSLRVCSRTGQWPGWQHHFAETMRHNLQGLYRLRKVPILHFNVFHLHAPYHGWAVELSVAVPIGKRVTRQSILYRRCLPSLATQVSIAAIKPTINPHQTAHLHKALSRKAGSGFERKCLRQEWGRRVVQASRSPEHCNTATISWYVNTLSKLAMRSLNTKRWTSVQCTPHLSGWIRIGVSRALMWKLQCRSM